MLDVYQNGKLKAPICPFCKMPYRFANGKLADIKANKCENKLLPQRELADITKRVQVSNDFSIPDLASGGYN